jgi:ABC-2 type transport system permease protein
MKAFIGFILKEFMHILRDRKTLLILFGMPIAQILIFGYGITNEIKNVQFAVFDQAKDTQSEKLIQKIQSSGYFTLAKSVASYPEIESEFRKGDIKIALVLPQNFSRDLNKTNNSTLQLIIDASDPNMGKTISTYLTSIIMDFNKELNVNVKYPMSVSMETRALFNPELKGVYMFVPGLITIVLMLISAMMTSISITKEKEMGSMEILLASPMNPGYLIAAKTLPYLALSFIDAVLIIILGRFVFEVPINGSLILLLAECGLFILTALSLGLFVSTKTSSQQTALMISLVGFMLPTILLSGFVFPIDNMPFWLQYITMINPGRWFMNIVRGIMIMGVGLEYLWKETLILISFVVVLIGLSIKNFKLRLE